MTTPHQRRLGVQQGRGAVVPPTPQPLTLDLAAFTGTRNQRVAPRLPDDILVYTVPEGLALSILPGPFGLTLDGVQTGTATTDAAGLLSVTLTTLRPLESANLPGIAGLILWTRQGAGNWLLAPDANRTINYVTRVVTRSGLGASLSHEWYARTLFGDQEGRVALEVQPAGVAANRLPLWSSNVNSANRRDQFDDRTGLRLGARVKLAPHDQLIFSLASDQVYRPADVMSPPGVASGVLARVEVRAQALSVAEIAAYAAQATGRGWTEAGVTDLIHRSQTGNLAGVDPRALPPAIPGWDF